MVQVQTDVLIGEAISVASEPGTPETFALAVQAYPSPFVGTATFVLSLPSADTVRLVVYDALGRLVSEVVGGEQAAGQHEVRWDARGLPSGVYFYRLTTGAGGRTGSLVKVR